MDTFHNCWLACRYSFFGKLLDTLLKIILDLLRSESVSIAADVLYCQDNI